MPPGCSLVVHRCYQATSQAELMRQVVPGNMPTFAQVAVTVAVNRHAFERGESRASAHLDCPQRDYQELLWPPLAYEK